ncbi:unnamed protein product [Macrosiphum euphorbiae]|uniref:Reverse transcriptase zinc-binding domain-containing protein n=1 Tax=Macrosiphum euphorbiae TaxID=13131 RepID=A0AAV0VVK9_9HEMI|nr:unnamed protein product [Macrosiphum euphorbiae]
MGISRERIKERTNSYKQIQNRPFPYHALISDNQGNPPPLCDTCKTPLTMAHIIIVCPKFSTARFLLNNPRSIEEALSQQNSDNIFKFFKKIELDKKL